ncbi:hypothetical protein HPB48_022139 [Haemaphysalis longicornis]|uniref:Uncharacterized protein n=1 Tax=Haemaphysalis longicornis TaxID=44386 RepID=A0A9J6H4R2_HAELO|nr:hypothetical protein HPB48_022139 [Haemaphysalis longicornis]
MYGEKRPAPPSVELDDISSRSDNGEDAATALGASCKESADASRDCDAKPPTSTSEGSLTPSSAADGQSHLAQAAIKKEEMPAEGVYIFFPANSCRKRPKLKLQSSDGKVFHVDVDVAKLSLTIKSMLDVCGVDGDDVVPLSNVRSEVLEKVLIWAAHHKDDGPTVKVSIHPPEFTENKEARTYDLYVAPWDRVFLVENRALLFELVGASIYLNISRLQDVACKTFATMIKGKTPAEIRRMFNIKNDFPPLLEKIVQEENSWGFA